MFRSKCAELEPRIKNLQEEIDKLTTANKSKEVVDYREKLTVLQYALEQYTYPDEGQNVPESVIEAFVTKIVVHPDSFDWYFRFDGDPSDPLRCKIEGKRRTTTKIVVAGVISPAIHTGNTGCYQNWGGLSYISSFPSVSMRRWSIKRPTVNTSAATSGKT